MVQVPDVVSTGLLGLRPKGRGFCRIILPTSCDTDFPRVFLPAGFDSLQDLEPVSFL